MKTIVTQLATIGTMTLIYMSYQWMEVGYGLHPFIALPIATLLMVVPYHIPQRVLS